MFDDILERRKTFLDSKMRKLKKSQRVHGFGQKFGNFRCFYFDKISQQDVFDNILTRK